LLVLVPSPETPTADDLIHANRQADRQADRQVDRETGDRASLRCYPIV